MADVILSKRWSAFLLAVALWNWLIWPRFALPLVSSMALGDRTAGTITS